MKRPKVYIASYMPKEIIDYIGDYCDYEIWNGEGGAPRKEILKRISDKDGVISSGTKVDKEFLEAAPNLKVVSLVSVGYNNFDIKAMKERNIIGTHTPYVLDDTVADLIFGLILSSARRISELDNYVKCGKWKAEDGENLFGVDVHHSTLGIIGMGRIGQAVAKRAKLGFDMEVLYYNRNRKFELEEKLGVEYSNMKSLLEKSDFVVLMTPFTKETYHLIDFEEFNLMKESTIFINASRGQTVNEKALIDALEKRKILGAALDVYEVEPINNDNLLLKFNNVVTVPHIGSSTTKTRLEMKRRAAENLVKALQGEYKIDIVPELK